MSTGLLCTKLFSLLVPGTVWRKPALQPGHTSTVWRTGMRLETRGVPCSLCTYNKIHAFSVDEKKVKCLLHARRGKQNKSTLIRIRWRANLSSTMFKHQDKGLPQKLNHQVIQEGTTQRDWQVITRGCSTESWTHPNFLCVVFSFLWPNLMLYLTEA